MTHIDEITEALKTTSETEFYEAFHTLVQHLAQETGFNNPEAIELDTTWRDLPQIGEGTPIQQAGFWNELDAFWEEWHIQEYPPVTPGITVREIAHFYYRKILDPDSS